MKVARGERRKAEDHRDDEHDGHDQCDLHVAHRGADRVGAVQATEISTPAGIARFNSGRAALNALHGLHDVGAGLTLNVQNHGGDFLAIMEIPGADAVVLHTADDGADIGQPHRGVVAPGDHQGGVLRGGFKLIVRAERDTASRGAVEPTLGTVDVRIGDGGANILHADSRKRRAARDRHARAPPGACRPDRDFADAVDLGEFRLQQGVRGVADLRDGDRIGGQRQRQDRRVGRDSPSNRRADTAGSSAAFRPRR